MKNVLLIAFYFPPRNHVAALRAGCFAKYLPEFGWLPTVLCDDWPAERGDHDPAHAGRLPPEVTVHRIPNRRPRGFVEKVLIHKLATYFAPGRAPVLWWRGALVRARNLVRTNSFDAIWATSDPLVTLGLAAQLAKEFRLPWIADLRDPFNVIPFGSWYKRPIYRRAELQLCRQADRVVTVSDGFASGLKNVLGKFVKVIPNGYDPTELLDPGPIARDRFVILHGGSVHFPRQRPDLLLRAVESCIAMGAIPRERLAMHFVGADLQMLGGAGAGLMQRLPITVQPRIPRSELLEMQRRAAVLVVFSVPRENGVLPAKVFECLAARRPILAVPDDFGEVTSLLRRTGAGVACSSVAEIAGQLTRWYSDWERGNLTPPAWDRKEVALYARHQQTKHLATLLDEVSELESSPAESTN